MFFSYISNNHPHIENMGSLVFCCSLEHSTATSRSLRIPCWVSSSYRTTIYGHSGLQENHDCTRAKYSAAYATVGLILKPPLRKKILESSRGLKIFQIWISNLVRGVLITLTFSMIFPCKTAQNPKKKFALRAHFPPRGFNIFQILTNADPGVLATGGGITLNLLY